jgi:hypothetical protein
MHESRILAVDHVHMEVRPGLSEQLIWFYGEVGALTLLQRGSADPFALRFKSGPLELRLLENEGPEIDGVEVRVTILVDSMPRTRELLEEAGLAYERVSSTVVTDRRISLVDPSGNRVEFKQHWPFAPL